MNYKTLENESLLVKSLSKSNLLAFNTLYNEYSGRLYRFAFGYLKSEDEAGELVQEVFTTIWEKRADLKEELSFKSFLFTIAFNIIKKHFRTRTYLNEYFKKEIGDDLDMQTSQKITYDSLYQYVTELVNQLPERRREIFIKSRFEGLSIKEIAKKLGISHKTVENQLTDALKFIRTNLNKEIISAILFFALFIS
ncbi:MAG: RNA polymerase sigma-70 factor [Bacteroidia bacterium]|jgi:RNA polymerase sigma-70 factor (ECF subfamily)|nr:RNA polymerase sigma-70 factor [Bacteroidia bacterium]